MIRYLGGIAGWFTCSLNFVFKLFLYSAEYIMFHLSLQHGYEKELLSFSWQDAPSLNL